MRWLASVLIALSACAATAQTADAVLEAHIAGQVDKLDLTAGPDDYTDVGPVRWRGLVSRLGSGFVRLLRCAPTMSSQWVKTW